jgi:hypothetical protein
MLKAAIMCYADRQLTEALALILLTICMEFKADLQASAAQLVYSEPLSISGELLAPTAEPVIPAHLIVEFHQHMACLRPLPAACHNSLATFVYSDFENYTNVFLCQDTRLRELEPPSLQWLLSGPVT